MLVWVKKIMHSSVKQHSSLIFKLGFIVQLLVSFAVQGSDSTVTYYHNDALLTGVGYFLTPSIANTPTTEGDHQNNSILDIIPAHLGGGLTHAAAKGVAKRAVTKGGLGKNPFKGKTPEQIDKMFKDKGFEPRGPDPLNGKGGYVNPKTGRSYHIDPGGKYKKGN